MIYTDYHRFTSMFLKTQFGKRAWNHHNYKMKLCYICLIRSVLREAHSHSLLLFHDRTNNAESPDAIMYLEYLVDFAVNGHIWPLLHIDGIDAIEEDAPLRQVLQLLLFLLLDTSFQTLCSLVYNEHINSLDDGWFELNFSKVIFKLILVTDG